MHEQHVLSQVQTLFHGKVKYLHLGCPDNFHPQSNGFEIRLAMVQKIVEDAYHTIATRTVLAPKVAFTNRIAIPDDDFAFQNQTGLHRTEKPADGVIVSSTDESAAIFNADCHIGILYHEKTHRFVLIHLGLKCFYREDGSSNIIDQAIYALGVPVRELQFWAGAGIGPCCNGYDHSDPKNAELGEKLNREFGYKNLPVVGYKYKDDLIESTGLVLHGPRKGQVSYDNRAMISQIAVSHSGMPVEISASCTSCQGREQFPDRPQMWSNVRGHKERNLFLCWLA